MSESEYDLDDELLHLAGASSENKRSKTSSSSRSKKRKVDSDNERDIESEEMSDVGPQDENADPYPYEGTYIDAEDKQKCVWLPILLYTLIGEQ
jgi:RNA polymerase-associated protein RTF1